MHHMQMWRRFRATRAINISHEMDEGWKKVERKLKGKGKEKKGVERKAVLD